MREADYGDVGSDDSQDDDEGAYDNASIDCGADRVSLSEPSVRSDGERLRLQRSQRTALLSNVRADGCYVRLLRVPGDTR